MAEVGDSHSLYVSVPFPSNQLAKIAYEVLRIDAEPKRSTVKKNLVVADNLLKLSLSAKEVRQIRVALTGFFDSLNLVVETMIFSGNPVSESYSHFNG